MNSLARSIRADAQLPMGNATFIRDPVVIYNGGRRYYRCMNDGEKWTVRRLFSDQFERCLEKYLFRSVSMYGIETDVKVK